MNTFTFPEAHQLNNITLNNPRDKGFADTSYTMERENLYNKSPLPLSHRRGVHFKRSMSNQHVRLNAKSICIIYAIEDQLESLYLKEFYKWIGFVYYVHPVYKVVKDDFEQCVNNPGSFDLYMIIGEKILSQEELEYLRLFGSAIQLDDVNTQNEKGTIGYCQDLLLQSIDKWMKYHRTSELKMVKDLADVYYRNELYGMLYSYTFVTLPEIYYQELMEEKKETSVSYINDRFESALAEIKKIDIGSDAFSVKKYLLYAEGICEYKLNFINYLRNGLPRYNEKDLLIGLGEIYDLDSSFLKVEYLRAKIAELGYETRAMSRIYYESCIDKCDLNVCNSVFMYELGKWLSNHKYDAAANVYYMKSHTIDPQNMKSLFKMAVISKQRDGKRRAKFYFERIIDVWYLTGKEKYVSLLKMEYIGKSISLLETMEMNDCGEYNDIKEQISGFLVGLKNEEKQDYYISKIYGNKQLQNAIISATAIRIEHACGEIGD